MVPTKLYTSDGCYVATVLLPPFIRPAEVVVWGERTFVPDATGRYVEGMMYVVAPNCWVDPPWTSPPEPK